MEKCVFIRLWLRWLLVLALLIAPAVAIATGLIVHDAVEAGRTVAAVQAELGGMLHGDGLLGVSRPRLLDAHERLADAAARLHRDRRLLGPAFPVLRASRPLPII